MRRQLIRREFGDDRGSVFEGTAFDFYPGWARGLEHKFGKKKTGRAKIQQLIDVLAGKGGEPLVTDRTEGRVLVPKDGSVDGAWTSLDFDDSAWQPTRGAVGFETETGFETLLRTGTDLREELYGKRTTVYLRYAFELEDLATIGGLVLHMRYDDGFVVYLNGHRVMAKNAPEEPSWASRAVRGSESK